MISILQKNKKSEEQTKKLKNLKVFDFKKDFKDFGSYYVSYVSIVSRARDVDATTMSSFFLVLWEKLLSIIKVKAR